MCKELDVFKDTVASLESGKKKKADTIKQLTKKLITETSKKLSKNKDLVSKLSSLYEISGLDELKSVEDFVQYSIEKNGIEDDVTRLAARINGEFKQFINRILSSIKGV
jgi:hypothetical protein